VSYKSIPVSRSHDMAAGVSVVRVVRLVRFVRIREKIA
jgi:hypothetical protein